jgi:hypothetical protein
MTAKKGKSGNNPVIEKEDLLVSFHPSFLLLIIDSV